MTPGGSQPLTLAESRERAGLVTVDGYEIDLDLARGPDLFGSRTTVRFRCARPGSATFVELRPSRLVSATLNGHPVDPARMSGNRLGLVDLLADNELVVDAEMPFSSTGEGMHRFVDPLDGETYVGAYLGVDNAQRVFANFDQPDLKAPITARVTAPAGWTVLSNSRRPDTIDDVHDVQGAQHRQCSRWDFATTPPLSTYLFVVVAGPLHSIHAQEHGTTFGLHCRRSLAAHLDQNATEILSVTTACFGRYREIFDEPYPFDSYDQAFVPELNWGAMESPGCITFRDDLVFRSAVTDNERLYRGMVIAHEMAHMWFGDLVTMRWWDDLWLSESFAEYMGFQVLSEATRFTDGWTSFAMAGKSWGYDSDQRPSTHPVAPDGALVADTESALANFDGISYAKGASALRQLSAWLGEGPFLAGVNDFLGRHRFGVATLHDLLDSLGRASGVDVHAWAQAWLRTTGVDTLRVVRDPGTDGAGSVRVEHPGLRPHLVTAGMYDRVVGEPGRLSLRRSVVLSLEQHHGSAALELGAGETAPALVLLNDSDITYGKVRLDDASLSAAMEGLSGVEGPLARAVVWTCVRDMVRDGELAPPVYLSMVRAHLPTENQESIVQGVLSFALLEVAAHYVGAGSRAQALAGLGDTCRAILDGGGHASAGGLRLAAARGVVDTARLPAHAAELRGWLAAGTVPGGPVLDADLRWRTLLRLAVMGEVAPDEIEAERARDATGSGPEWAARCLAARPELEAKESAWATMFGARDQRGGGVDASKYIVSATARGFWQPEQRELLAPFVSRWFDATVAVSARRGPAVAEAIAADGFPHHDIDQSTLRAGEQCLASGTATPALRRILVDQLDDVRRALRVRDVRP